MKLISLNTWGGRAGRENLLSFFQHTKNSIDVFCLQEIWSDDYDQSEGILPGGLPIDNDGTMTNGLQNISEVLNGYSVYFRPHLLDHYGLASFAKSVATEEGEVFVYREKGYVPTGDLGNHARNIQYLSFDTVEGKRTVINFHGLWNGQGKGDSPDRLQQSKAILDFVSKRDHPFVLCGDFNLMPETKSLKMFELFGLRNLLIEHNITSTRSSFYTKEVKFADYILVSDGIVVDEFKVLPQEVSDHLPLYLEFH
jgi:exonuclease III